MHAIMIICKKFQQEIPSHCDGSRNRNSVQISIAQIFRFDFVKPN